MASFELARPDVFPNGTTVGAYLRSSWAPGRRLSGAPPAAAVSSAAVASDSVTLTGLTEGVRYVAGADVGGTWKYVQFGVPVPDEADSSVFTDDVTAQDGTAGEVAIGALGPSGRAAILLGDDTSLYRDSANVIRTDDYLYGALNILAKFNETTQVFLGDAGDGKASVYLGAYEVRLYHVSTGVVGTDSDLEVTSNAKGVILKSPDGTRYRVKVANGGALSAVAA